MIDLAVRRLRRLPVLLGAGLSPSQTVVVRAELARLGVELDTDVFDLLHPDWLAHWPTVRAALAELRGDGVAYVPLFSSFPDDVPDDLAYFAQRVLGYLGLNTFDCSAFGADPVSQLHDPLLFAAALDRQSVRPDGRVEPLKLTVLAMDELDDALHTWCSTLLAAKSSIPEAQHADLQRVLLHLGPDGFDLDAIGQKETAALVLALFWRSGRLDAVQSLAKTPTDLLRMFASLTDTDVSLATTCRFPRFTRAQRRCVMTVLEASPQLSDDLLRYEGLWKAVARSLHSREYARSHPRAVATIQSLRAGDLRSWESVVEQGIRDRNRSVLAHLSTRPGSFARRLHALLGAFGVGPVLSAFAPVAPQVPAKVLLSLHAHFASIDTAMERAVVTKKGRIKVLDNPHRHALGPAGVAPVLALLEHALVERFAARESWTDKTVWLHPKLADYTVPLQLRSASDGLLSLGRGSRVSIGDASVVRLFVWWVQTARDTDLDLSAVTFDADFNYLGHVSYTQLSGEGMAHSGDLQSTGPEGATEFIDLQLASLPANVAFIAPQIHRYAGESFLEVTAHAGWMLRDSADGSWAGFDPATVQNKFEVSGVGSYVVPFILDVRSGDVTLVDLYIGNQAFQSNTEGSLNALARATRAVADFTHTRPNLRTLAELHVRARGGTKVGEAANADIVFGTDEGTFQAHDPVGLLAALL